MIYITSIRDRRLATGEFDEIWAIVRSNKKLSSTSKLLHVPGLSPSWDLFKQYRQLVESGNWNYDSFQKYYVPVFLKEMQQPGSQNLLNRLVQMHNEGRSVALCCFCTDETLCHRSIIAGLLQTRGIPVQGLRRDYSSYAMKL